MAACPPVPELKPVNRSLRAMEVGPRENEVHETLRKVQFGAGTSYSASSCSADVASARTRHDLLKKWELLPACGPDLVVHG